MAMSKFEKEIWDRFKNGYMPASKIDEEMSLVTGTARETIINLWKKDKERKFDD